MKKIVIGIFAMVFAAGAKAQESNVLSSWEYMNVYNIEKKNGNIAVAIENLIKAKESIDAAAVNEKTINKSKTWKRRAEVYMAIMNETNDGVAQFKKGVIEEIYTSLEKARTVEINEKNNKPKIFEESDVINKARYLCDTLFKTGTNYYVAQDFENAGMYFEKRYSLLKSMGITDTVSYTNMFLSAFRGKNLDKAVDYGNQLMQWGVSDANLYGTMARIYQDKGESEKGLKIIQDARQKYPKNTEFITEELNYYLTVGDNEKSVKLMNEAMEAFKDDKDMLKSLFFNSGVIYFQLKDIEKSKEYYKKALEIDPQMFGALNNYAALILDDANNIIKEANNLPLNQTKKYEEMKNQANALYKEAGSYLETAYALKPSDKLRVTILEIFTKLQDEEKMIKYKK
ncbi:MAG: tetratricopeptide repeat protein [Flavobacteriales bacterium]|nr:tetratricopeptide repeat protein [Flavobacteriales bacterium]